MEYKMQQVFIGASFIISKGHFWTQIKAPGCSFQLKLSLMGNQKVKPNLYVRCWTVHLPSVRDNPQSLNPILSVRTSNLRQRDVIQEHLLFLRPQSDVCAVGIRC